MIFETESDWLGGERPRVFSMPASLVGGPPFDTLLLRGAHEFYKRVGVPVARVILMAEEMAAVLKDEKTLGLFRYAAVAPPSRGTAADQLGAWLGFEIIVERRRHHELVKEKEDP
jgi:hypothetical protein